MTKPFTNSISYDEELFELLIKNLPKRLKAGKEKGTSNIKEYCSIIALEHMPFMNFNSKERISIMVFDIDKAGDKTALEHFKNIEGLLSFIVKKIGYEPTYILQTTKGFHFGYHLKNHIYTHQPKAVEYLRNIKIALTDILGCDTKASHRLNGVWRNPLHHPHYYSGKLNYELNDFREFLPLRVNVQRTYTAKVKIDASLLIEGNRNEALFRYAMKYAKGQSSLEPEQILDFLMGVNVQCSKPLEDDELHQIASSVYGYWCRKTIQFGTLIQREPIPNEGIMEFQKMAGLTLTEYETEVKRRQRLSAQRTNRIKDKEKASKQLAAARECSAQKRRDENEKKVLQTIEQLREEGKKITTSAISKIAKIDRRTVKQYRQFQIAEDSHKTRVHCCI